MFKNLLFKQKSLFFVKMNFDRCNKLASFYFSQRNSKIQLNAYSFQEEKTITIVERVNLLDQYLRTQIKEGKKKLMDETSRQMIFEIEKEEYEEEYQNPIFINKFISVYCYLKIIPNSKFLNKVLRYIENQVYIFLI